MPMLRQNHVTAYLCGHDHNLQVSAWLSTFHLNTVKIGQEYICNVSIKLGHSKQYSNVYRHIYDRLLAMVTLIGEPWDKKAGGVIPKNIKMALVAVSLGAHLLEKQQ